MAACKKNAEKADFLVWIVGPRFGLADQEGGTDQSISEGEYRAARGAGKPALILVRDEVWRESKLYHSNARAAIQTGPGAAGTSRFKADERVLKMLERLMHEKDDKGNRAVPWIEAIRDAHDALDQIKNKLLIWQRNQAKLAEREAAGVQLALFDPRGAQPPNLEPLADNSSIAEIQSWLDNLYRDGNRWTTSQGACPRFGIALAAPVGNI